MKFLFAQAMGITIVSAALIVISNEGREFLLKGGGRADFSNPEDSRRPELSTPSKAPAVGPGTAILVADTVMKANDPLARADATLVGARIDISVDPNNAESMILSAVSSGPDATVMVWRSTDGGTSWSKELTSSVPRLEGASWCHCEPTPGFHSPSGTTGPDNTKGDRADAGSTLQNSNQQLSLLAAFQSTTNVELITGRSMSASALKGTASSGSGKEKGNQLLEAVVARLNPAPAAEVNVAEFADQLVRDERTGNIYRVFERIRVGEAEGSEHIDYVLNRSTDGGRSWELNGAVDGIIIATTERSTPVSKFCTVNAAAERQRVAVSPQTGDLHYLYTKRDLETGDDRLAMRRLLDDGNGGLETGPEVFISGQGQAALPSMAIASNDTIGVFYYLCDGISLSGYPMLSAHMSYSTDHGQSFVDNLLSRFSSPAKDDGSLEQRVLGESMQIRTAGDEFIGGFMGTSESIKPAVAHPIFYKVSVGRAAAISP